MARITALGSGIMATVLPFLASENGNEVHLIGTFLGRKTIGLAQKTGMHPGLGFKVNESVKAYQLGKAADVITDAGAIMCGVNSFGIEWAGERFSKPTKPGQKFLTVAKGIQADGSGTMHILPNVLRSYFDPGLAESVFWNATINPSIAGGLTVHHDMYVVFRDQNEADIECLADLFRTDYYHVWMPTGFVGYGTGAITKNVYASATGFAQEVLRKTDKKDDRYVIYNCGVAVFAQGQEGLRPFIRLMGGDPETSDSLGRVGDIFATSMGGHNVKAGGYTGEGIAFSKVQDRCIEGVTLEGVATIKVTGKALRSLTERGVTGGNEYPLRCSLYSVTAESASLKMLWDGFFQGLE